MFTFPAIINCCFPSARYQFFLKSVDPFCVWDGGSFLTVFFLIFCIYCGFHIHFSIFPALHWQTDPTIGFRRFQFAKLRCLVAKNLSNALPYNPSLWKPRLPHLAPSDASSTSSFSQSTGIHYPFRLLLGNEPPLFGLFLVCHSLFMCGLLCLRPCLVLF